MRLLETLVDLVLLYGTEVLGMARDKTGKSVDDRDWNDVKRQCVEGGKVEVGS